MNDLLTSLNTILDYKLGDNDLRHFLYAFLAFLAIYVSFKIFKAAIIRALKKLSLKTKTDFDDYLITAIENIPNWFYFVLAIYLPLQFVITYPEVEFVSKAVFMFALVYEGIQVVSILFDYSLKKLAFGEKRKAVYSETTFHGIHLIFKIVLWASGMLLLFSNLGFDVTSLVASLGVGGVAIALAVQNILADIFSSFSIYFDRPFEVGDFVVLGTDSGTVKKIGLKTTRIMTLQGQELVVSNQELTAARVQNFKKMKKRRIVFPFHLDADTPTNKVEKALEIVKNLIEKDEHLELSRIHFSEITNFSLSFECVYLVLSSDYNVFMDAKQKLNLDILNAFKKEGIKFARFERAVSVDPLAE